MSRVGHRHRSCTCNTKGTNRFHLNKVKNHQGTIGHQKTFALKNGLFSHLSLTQQEYEINVVSPPQEDVN